MKKQYADIYPDLSVDEASAFLKKQLRLQIKEKLSISLNNNPQVIVKIPCKEEVYENIFGTASSKRRSLSIKKVTDLLWAGWDERILNQNLEFAYVVDKVWVLLSKTRPLSEYTVKDGKLVEIRTEKWDNLSFRFVRSYRGHTQWHERHPDDVC